MGLGDRESLEQAVRDFAKVRSREWGGGDRITITTPPFPTILEPGRQAVELGDKDCAAPLRDAKKALKKLTTGGGAEDQPDQADSSSSSSSPPGLAHGKGSDA